MDHTEPSTPAAGRRTDVGSPNDGGSTPAPWPRRVRMVRTGVASGPPKTKIPSPAVASSTSPRTRSSTWRRWIRLSPVPGNRRMPLDMSRRERASIPPVSPGP